MCNFRNPVLCFEEKTIVNVCEFVCTIAIFSLFDFISVKERQKNLVTPCVLSVERRRLKIRIKKFKPSSKLFKNILN